MIEPSTNNFLVALGLFIILYTARFLFLIFFSDCDAQTYFSRVSTRAFCGKVAWITGASSGIGEALAHRLAREGALLVLSSRSKEDLERVAASLPCSRDNVDILPIDFTADTAVLERLAETVPEMHGRLDFIFNNAGVSQRSSAADLDIEHVRHMFDIDFFAQAAITRACLPALRESPGGPGLIINTLSIAAIVNTPLRSTYCAAKAAMAAYFTCLELEEPLIRVVNIFPGSVRTRICINAMGKGGKRHGKTDPNIENGLDADRVADRMLAAVSAGLHKAWIARPKELNTVRVATAFPALWRPISMKIKDEYRRKIEGTPAATAGDMDKDTDKDKDA